MKVRRSRKAYIIAYLMGVILISVLLYIYSIGKSLSNSLLTASIIFIIAAIKFSEFYRIQDWWAITKNSIIHTNGIFNKDVIEVPFEAISDTHLSQSILKRFIGYGDVHVRAFSDDTSINIDNIDKPREFIEELNKAIDKNRQRNG